MMSIRTDVESGADAESATTLCTKLGSAGNFRQGTGVSEGKKAHRVHATMRERQVWTNVKETMMMIRLHRLTAQVHKRRVQEVDDVNILPLNNDTTIPPAVEFEETAFGGGPSGKRHAKWRLK